uniref:Keratinocyte differentiation associated protein n=1 Tax=Monodelphis domestica TaxID=13616 RepID=F6W8F1_MONDO
MKVPVLSIAVLFSLLALHSAQGAALGDSWGMTTESNYAEESKAFQSKEFLNWHAFFEALKEKLPFLNWEVLPKLKGMRSIIPDGQ